MRIRRIDAELVAHLRARAERQGRLDALASAAGYCLLSLLGALLAAFFYFVLLDLSRWAVSP